MLKDLKPGWIIWASFMMTMLVLHLFFQKVELPDPVVVTHDPIDVKAGEIPGEFFSTEVDDKECTLWVIDDHHASIDCRVKPVAP